jgi:hypothetical protein
VDSARYSQVNGVVHFRIQIHVTTKGTAAGSLKFTLPVAAGTSSSAFSGANTSDSLLLTCTLASGGATVIVCTKYDGSDPLADNKFYVISGSYEAAA